MSHHRDLQNAQNELLEKCAVLYDVFLRTNAWALPVLFHQIRFEFLASFDRYDDLRKELGAAGATSPRDTSIASGLHNLPLKRSVRYRVIQTICAQYANTGVGMTTNEVEHRLRRSHQTVSSAMNYAEQHGFIKDSGTRRNTQYGRPAIVFIPTDTARHVMLEAALEEREP